MVKMITFDDKTGFQTHKFSCSRPLAPTPQPICETQCEICAKRDAELELKIQKPTMQ